MDWLFKLLKMPPVNQVILIVTFVEFIIMTATSLISPLFALFIVQDVGASVTVVGFAVAIMLITKSLLQLPLARRLDKNHGEVDDYYSMLFGMGIIIVTTYLFYFVNAVWQIFVLQLFMGAGYAFVIPPLLAIFSRHMDKGQEAFEWALNSSFAGGISQALGGAFSGILATTIGIRPIYIVQGTILLFGLIMIVFLGPYIKQKVPKDLSQFYNQKKL